MRIRVTLPRFDEEVAIDFLLDTGSDRTLIHGRDRDRLIGEAVRTGSGLTPDAEMTGLGGGPLAYAAAQAEYTFRDEDGVFRPLAGSVHIALEPAARGVPSLLGRDILDVMLFCISDRENTLDW